MQQDRQDKLLRAYARLKSLQSNIREIKLSTVSEAFINEYHDILDKLSDMQFDVVDFRIPAKEIKEGSYDIFVERAFILSKIGAIIGYFEIILSPEPKKIGFHKTED